MSSTSTAVRARKQWLVDHMGKGSDARGTMVAAFGRDEDRCGLERILGPCRWNLVWKQTCAGAVEAVRDTAAPIIISDQALADGNWRELWHQLQETSSPPMFILGSRMADESLWAELLNLGGYNLLSIPFDPEEVIRTVHGALMQWYIAESAKTKPCVLRRPARVWA